ncbi:DoxX family protein [Kordiimonas sp.]|uniref:DoxX family protein n=1 Tax=Kordiimonas sp. TaxID=1970157 RepID=UPI003A8EF965
MTLDKLLSLPQLQSLSDTSVLMARLVVGSFLIWGVLDNILSAERMAEFVSFLTAHKFPWPEFMAWLSVWAQFLIGVSFILGLGIRLAGLLCMVNFIVAIVMVDMHGGIRASFSSACLILFGFYFATTGGGLMALDRLIMRHDIPHD